MIVLQQTRGVLFKPTVAAVGNGWNPADKSPDMNLSNGNRTASIDLGDQNSQVRSVDTYSSGKYYFEVTLDAGPNSNYPYVGIRPASGGLTGTGPFDPGGDYGIYALSPNTGHMRYVPGSNAGSVGPAVAVNDVYMIAADFGAGKVWVGMNGTWDGSGNPASGTNPLATGISGTYAAWVAVTTLVTVTGNFTRSDMAHTVPTGFLAWDGT